MSTKTNSGEKNRIPRDLIVLGVLMIISGAIDAYFILKNPDYEFPVFGEKLSGKAAWYFILITIPAFHFIVGYGAIRARRWAYYLFLIPALYMIGSALVGLVRLPPPHRIRTTFLLAIPPFLAYLYWRRKHFKT